MRLDKFQSDGASHMVALPARLEIALNAAASLTFATNALDVKSALGNYESVNVLACFICKPNLGCPVDTDRVGPNVLAVSFDLLHGTVDVWA